MTAHVKITNHAFNKKPVRYSRTSLLGDYSEIVPGQEVELTVYPGSPLLIEQGDQQRIMTRGVRVGLGLRKIQTMQGETSCLYRDTDIDPREMIRPGAGNQGEGFALWTLRPGEFCIQLMYPGGMQDGWFFIGVPPTQPWNFPRWLILPNSHYSYDMEKELISVKGLIECQGFVGTFIDNVWEQIIL